MFNLKKKELEKIYNVLLKPDGVIAFPTDTVWGVGCLVENQAATEKIYTLKGRPTNKPLILLSNDIENLLPYVKEVSLTAKKIIDKYFPGAVTLILQKSELTPDYITSGANTIGIRVPDYAPFQELLEKAVKNNVLATTSANLSGEKTSISKEDVELSIGQQVDYIVDSYDFPQRQVESTVVSVLENGEIKILRQGAVKIKIN